MALEDRLQMWLTDNYDLTSVNVEVSAWADVTERVLGLERVA